MTDQKQENSQEIFTLGRKRNSAAWTENEQVIVAGAAWPEEELYSKKTQELDI